MESIQLYGINANVARSFYERAKGLLGRRNLPQKEGLLILRCNAIHTFFMKFAIDAIFLDGKDRIVKIVRNIPPGRFCVFGGWRAVKVLETAVNAVWEEKE